MWNEYEKFFIWISAFPCMRMWARERECMCKFVFGLLLCCAHKILNNSKYLLRLKYTHICFAFRLCYFSFSLFFFYFVFRFCVFVPFVFRRVVLLILCLNLPGNLWDFKIKIHIVSLGTTFVVIYFAISIFFGSALGYIYFNGIFEN